MRVPIREKDVVLSSVSTRKTNLRRMYIKFSSGLEYILNLVFRTERHNFPQELVTQMLQSNIAERVDLFHDLKIESYN